VSRDPGGRLFASLPAVYRAADQSGDLAELLDVFEQLLFRGSEDAAIALHGVEASLNAIPYIFAPLGASAVEQTPERFLHWLARWLAFSPHAYFSPPALRRILIGIVPMYGRRGTRHFLKQLLELCFEGEIGKVHVDDRPRVGFTIGQSHLGLQTRLARARAFCFQVKVEVLQQAHDACTVADADVSLVERLHAVIEFSKPAHTGYELSLLTETAVADTAAV
jgi:phage tail-like protein